MNQVKRALFLDRDGILTQPVLINNQMDVARVWSEIEIYPKAHQLQELKKLGFLLILVANQPDIEHKIIAQEFIDQVHKQFREALGLDAVYCCPFASDEHPDKKPNPGMFLRAAKDFSLTLPKCFHLGHTDHDIDVARRCGCKSILWDRPYNKALRADHRVTGLEELKSILMSAQ